MYVNVCMRLCMGAHEGAGRAPAAHAPADVHSPADGGRVVSEARAARAPRQAHVSLFSAAGGGPRPPAISGGPGLPG